MDKIVPDFDAQVRAVQRVERLLKQVTNAMNEAGIDYAVVGGNAVAAWVCTVDEGAERATRDVDILVRREDLRAVEEALQPLDFRHVEVMGVHMFVEKADPHPARSVHLVIANEKVRPENEYPAPDPARSCLSSQGFRVINLPELLAMKLQAYRSIDKVHIIDMDGVRLLTPEVLDALPTQFRERVRETLAHG